MYLVRYSPQVLRTTVSIMQHFFICPTVHHFPKLVHLLVRTLKTKKKTTSFLTTPHSEWNPTHLIQSDSQVHWYQHQNQNVIYESNLIRPNVGSMSLQFSSISFRFRCPIRLCVRRVLPTVFHWSMDAFDTHR